MNRRFDAALAELRALARPGEIEAMARFGMAPERRLGVAVPALRALAKRIGRDHELALALWDTAIPDACMLAAMTCEPARLTVRQMDAWARSLRSWDVCDQACNNAFVRSPLAWDRVRAWAPREPEFVRRAAFALLAQLAVHDKAAPDAAFVEALVLVEAAADDDRPMVRKAVNWALRQIGKRNAGLLVEARACAQRLKARGSRAARWIAADALREFAARQAKRASTS